MKLRGESHRKIIVPFGKAFQTFNVEPVQSAKLSILGMLSSFITCVNRAFTDVVDELQIYDAATRNFLAEKDSCLSLVVG